MLLLSKCIMLTALLPGLRCSAPPEVAAGSAASNGVKVSRLRATCAHHGPPRRCLRTKPTCRAPQPRRSQRDCLRTLRLPSCWVQVGDTILPRVVYTPSLQRALAYGLQEWDHPDAEEQQVRPASHAHVSSVVHGCMYACAH